MAYNKLPPEEVWKKEVPPVKEIKNKDKGPFWIRSQDNSVIYGEKPEKRGKDNNRRGRP